LSPSSYTVDGGASGGSGAAGGLGTTYSPNLTAAGSFAGVAQSSTQVLWTWTAAGGQAGYVVLASTGGAKTGLLGAGELGLLETGLDPNTAYGALLRAYGCAHSSDTGVSFSTTLAKPVAAAAFTGVFASSVTVGWARLPAAPQKDSGTGYLLQASTAADFSGTVSSSQTAVLALSTLTVFSPALERNTTYYFRVASLNLAGDPDFGAVVLATATLYSEPGAGSPALPAASSTSVTGAWTTGSPANPALKTS